MRPSEFVRRIKKEGFAFDHHCASHDFYVKGSQIVMVERHNREIKKKTLEKMKQDAGLK